MKDIAKHFRYVFKNIIQRCNNPKNPGYKHYGGRGIKCLWRNYREFENDMYVSYFEAIYDGIKPSIERINNDGHYCRKNCRWATTAEQALNKRKSIYTHKVSQYVNEELEITKNVYRSRLWKGWSEERALSTPAIPLIGKKYSFNGREMTLYAWAKEFGLNPTLVYFRVNRYGWGLKDALTQKAYNKKRLQST